MVGGVLVSWGCDNGGRGPCLLGCDTDFLGVKKGFVVFIGKHQGGCAHPKHSHGLGMIHHQDFVVDIEKDLGAICGSREDVAVLIKTSANLQANNKMATAVVLKVSYMQESLDVSKESSSVMLESSCV